MDIKIIFALIVFVLFVVILYFYYKQHKKIKITFYRLAASHKISSTQFALPGLVMANYDDAYLMASVGKLIPGVYSFTGDRVGNLNLINGERHLSCLILSPDGSTTFTVKPLPDGSEYQPVYKTYEPQLPPKVKGIDLDIKVEIIPE